MSSRIETMENSIETLLRSSEDFWRLSEISKRKVTHGCGLGLESYSFD
jgi:hypothetical protein